jgi:universal stress protein A
VPYRPNHRPVIVCAVDLGDPQERPTLVACELSDKLGATLHLLHVEMAPSGSLSPERREKLEGELANYARTWPSQPPSLTTAIAAGDASHEITVYAKGVQADYVVMGTHGRSGLARAIIGSVAESVLRHAPCPVVVVPLPSP